MAQNWRVGIDIGGTFTDVVALDGGSGTLRSAKVPSRPDAPVAAIREALAAVGLELDNVADLIHGTTRVTNAIVEDRLPPVALIQTEGFTDTLDIGRQSRRELYRMDSLPKLPSLIPAERRVPLAERLDHRGEVLRALTDAEIERAVDAARATGAEAVAVSLLHSYANPAHEIRVGECLAGIAPHVSLSHRVNPEAREFERTAATALNAAVMPITVDYMAELEREVPLGDRLHIFHSAGGMASPEAVRERPLIMALSGPAAGVAAAARAGRQLDRPAVLSFDMGGTTTDVCLISGGRAEVSDDRAIAGRPLRQPMVNVHSIGAGGGSIVSLGAGGLSVGPESAGADPGPACYGQGGTRPTVTDANLLLGYLDADRRLGDSIRLDPALARIALEPLSEALGVDVVRCALGVLRIADATMARALRRVTVERGIDGRKASLLAFGGAGPMHAAGLAREFGISQVIVPAVSSGFSALGCLVADVSHSQQRTVRMTRDNWNVSRFETIRAELAEPLRSPLEARGLGPRIVTENIALMRYAAQNYTVEVAFTAPTDADRLETDFHRAHEALYGFATDEEWVVQGVRVQVSVPSEIAMPEPAGGRENIPRTRGSCWFAPDAPVDTPRFERDGLVQGEILAGPAIVGDALSTIVVPPGWHCRPDALGNLFLEETTT